MTSSDDRYPPDDYVIGEPYPPPSRAHQSETSAPGETRIGEDPYDRWDQAGDYQGEPDDGGTTIGVIDGTQYADEYDDDAYYEEEAEPYYDYDDGWEDQPARQPVFYVFVAVAVLLGGLFVFMLFTLFNSGDDDGEPTAADPAFNIQINRPADNERVQVGEDVEVDVQANATEQIVRIELLADGNVVDQAEFSDTPPNGIYSATLVTRFEQTGNYNLGARAVSISGATKKTDTIRVVAVELVDEAPAQITAEVITAVNARTGPGDEYSTARTFEGGEQVVLTGRSPGNDWVLLDDGTWVRAAALRLHDSLALLPVRRPTPTPAPTSTPTPEPSETPTPDTDAPDLAPRNAELASEGKVLRVTVENLSTSEFSGPLVIGVDGLADGAMQEAFVVQIPAGGTQVVSFNLATAVTEQSTISVTVDDGNAIEESNEDNNLATFVLAPAVEPPQLDIAATVGDSITVTLTNTGGKLDSASVRVRVSLQGNEASQTRTISLENGQSADFVVARPQGSGEAQITVFVNDQQIASSTVDIPGNEPAPTETPTPE